MAEHVLPRSLTALKVIMALGYCEGRNALASPPRSAVPCGAPCRSPATPPCTSWLPASPPPPRPCRPACCPSPPPLVPGPERLQPLPPAPSRPVVPGRSHGGGGGGGRGRGDRDGDGGDGAEEGAERPVRRHHGLQRGGGVRSPGRPRLAPGGSGGTEWDGTGWDGGSREP